MTDTPPSGEYHGDSGDSLASEPQTPRPPRMDRSPKVTQTTDAPLEGDVRVFALLANILGIFAPIIAPLVIWLLKKEDLPEQCLETLNFQITWFGAAILLCFTCFGVLLAVPLGIATMVFLILAAISINKGEPYSFPWKLDVVK